MFARFMMTALTMSTTLGLLISSPARAQMNPDQSLEATRLMGQCGEVKMAKHISLMVMLALASTEDTNMEMSLDQYAAEVNAARDCAALDHAYAILTAAAATTKIGDAEAYLAGPGKVELDQMIAQVHALLQSLPPQP